MNRQTITKLFSILILTVCLVPAYAQDSTAEPSPAATVDAPVVISVEPSAQSSDPLAVIVGLALAFVSGSAVTLVAVASFVSKVMNDPVKMMLAERLGNSIPVELGRSMSDSLATIATFVSKTTDHIPEASKIAPTTISIGGGSGGAGGAADTYTVSYSTDTLPPSATLTQPMPLPDNPSV